MSDNEQKDLIKQAIKEWMDERASEFGWYILKRMMAAALTSGLAWFIIHSGYKFPPS
jgi:hypothetical protein